MHKITCFCLFSIWGVLFFSGSKSTLEVASEFSTNILYLFKVNWYPAKCKAIPGSLLNNSRTTIFSKSQLDELFCEVYLSLFKVLQKFQISGKNLFSTNGISKKSINEYQEHEYQWMKYGIFLQILSKSPLNS